MDMAGPIALPFSFGPYLKPYHSATKPNKKGQLSLTNPATLAKSLHGLRKSSGVVSCVAIACLSIAGLKVGRYAAVWHTVWPKFEPWQYRLQKAKGTPWERTVLYLYLN